MLSLNLILLKICFVRFVNTQIQKQNTICNQKLLFQVAIKLKTLHFRSMKAVWSEDQWIQDHQSKPEATDQPVEIVDSNKVETVTKKSKPQVSYRKLVCETIRKSVSNLFYH